MLMRGPAWWQLGLVVHRAGFSAVLFGAALSIALVCGSGWHEPDAAGFDLPCRQGLNDVGEGSPCLQHHVG